MKKIHLIRHAKSSWKNEQLADIHRPLSQRGIRSVDLMAAHIVEAGCGFNNVFCSPALRAQSTIELLGKTVPDIALKWQIDNQLYCFDSNSLHQWCAGLDESISEVVIVGHNPALTDFCNALSKCWITNIPTCAYVQLCAQTAFKWTQLSKASFELSHFLKPKDLVVNKKDL